MIKKQYPKAIVMRKYLILATGVILVLILGIIVSNLVHASHQSSEQMITQTATTTSLNTATSADTDWYQNISITKPVPATKVFATTPQHDLVNAISTLPLPQSLISLPVGVDRYNQAPSKIYQMTDSSTGVTSPDSIFKRLNIANMLGVKADDDPNKQGEKITFIQTAKEPNENYLPTTLNNPVSRYEIKAGTIVPGILITGINSDLPGQITGQVSENVYDTITGRYLLIPQGAKLTGLYDSKIAYGQERVLIAWQRIIFPNGQSIDLSGMPGIDLSGYAGFHDQVNNHYGKIFGSALLMSVISAGAQLSQPQNTNNPYAAPTVGQTLAQSLGTNIMDTGTMITRKNLNIQPTLSIQAGYLFNINITKDIVFPGPYSSETTYAAR
ncbi:MAG: TrbI/VirB10 family protein [Gammaproteobacteria bacterium]